MFDSCVLKYLENSAIKYKNKLAFVSENKSITFEETKYLSMCISNQIIKNIGFHQNKPILVFLPKDIDAIISMLGIVYSGNFYTPTSIDFPEKKLLSIIDALIPSLIITNSENKDRLLNLGIDEDIIILYDLIDFKQDIGNLKTNIENSIDTDIVYTYFTSGSTGIPKGVTINHKNILDFTESACKNLPIDENTIFGNQSAFYFDHTTQDLYTTLKEGATLVIIPESLFAFPKKLIEFVNEKSINFLFWVPSVFINVCLFKALDNVTLEKVKAIMFAGEVMPVKYFNEWKKHLPNLICAVNAYGPTETTVDCTYYFIDLKKDYTNDEEFPIGNPISNTRILLIDYDDKQIIKPNIKAELCILGTCVSPGYYKNSEKTKEVFVQNPLHNDFNDIMYKTGDLAMYNENGLLFFCGRKDNQIKHLGYRIELGEIETAVLSLDFITNCVVLYDEASRKIILFYVSKGDSVTERELKLSLTKIIPKYMIPTKYYKLDTLPINNNGKIDRLKLKTDYIK